MKFDHLDLISSSEKVLACSFFNSSRVRSGLVVLEVVEVVADVQVEVAVDRKCVSVVIMVVVEMEVAVALGAVTKDVMVGKDFRGVVLNELDAGVVVVVGVIRVEVIVVEAVEGVDVM